MSVPRLTRRKRLLFRVAGALLASSAAVAIGECAARTLGLSKTYANLFDTWRYYGYDPPDKRKLGFTRMPRSRWLAGKKEIRTNQDGFRDRDFAVEKRAGVRRVAFLGDSVTEGHGVAEGDRFTSLLQSTPGVEIFNLAVSGQATIDEDVILRGTVTRFRPDQVVLQVCFNDIAPNNRKPWFTEERRPPTTFLQRHSALYLALAERWGAHALKNGGRDAILRSVLATTSEDLDVTTKLLTDMSHFARSQGATFTVVYIPYAVEVIAGRETDGLSFTELLGSRLESEKVSVFKLTRELRAEGGDLYLDDCHLNERGHRAVAKLLQPLLTKG